MNSRILSILAAITSVVVLCGTSTHAAIPQTINYQGYVTSPSGAAINNPTVSMVFKLYDAVTGGNVLHTETQTVAVSNGIFNVVLGTTTALTASFDGPYWLGVTVGGDAEMSPRQPLAASPYAMRAANADSLAPGGNIVLTAPSTATTGNIMKGATRFIHNFGSGNTFVGEGAGNFALSGPFNTAVGYAALQNNTTGNANTASGFLALFSNTIGNQNTASGSGALQNNTTGVNNTASGVNALLRNTTGGDNAAFGLGALNSNVTGTANTALGRHALFNSGKTVTAGAFVTGVPYTIQSVGTTNFTAIGASSNAVGTVFTATGAGSGTGTAASNTGNNTAIGYLALFNNETGVNNIAIGQSAGNTIGASGSNNMVIGNGGVAGDNSTIRLGDPAVHTKTLLAGNVGIGTNNPYSKLHVFGYGIANGIDLGDRADNPGTNSANIYLTATGNGILSIVASKNGVGFGNVALQEFGGNVGIGTTTPTKARLEISGFVNTNLAAGAGIAAADAGNPVGTFNAGINSLSLYADQGIAAPFFVAPSDERIKRIAGRSDATRDLATLAAIEVTDYTYLDTATKGTGKHKKVIARQVEGVYPQAVSRGTDVVPDIYTKAPVKGGWVNLATNLKKGERVRLIGNKKDAVHEVLEVAPGRFRTDFAADGDAVFVYGREVKDLRMVDYEAIAMLNVSATQELNRRVERQDAKIAQLERQLALLAQLQAQVAEIAKANTTQIAYRPTSN